MLSTQQGSTEDLNPAVYFSRFPTPKEEDEFRNLLGGWLTMGTYEALGGFGLHSYRKIDFDKKTDSAHLEADIVGTNPDAALPMLIRALEGFDAVVLHIEAIIM